MCSGPVPEPRGEREGCRTDLKRKDWEGLLLWQLLRLLPLSFASGPSTPSLGRQEVVGEVTRCPHLEAAPPLALGVESQSP